LQVPLLLEREVRRQAARIKAPASLRWIAFIAVAWTAILGLLEPYLHLKAPGEVLFLGLFIPTAVLLLQSGNGIAAELVEHRRNKTMGLLFLTHSRPHDFFIAKISSAIVIATYRALALLPCLAISLIYGGVSWDRCIAAAIFIVVEVIFLVAFEFVGAAITADPAGAGLISNITRGVLLFWPWVLDRLSSILAGKPLPNSIYLFSPFHAGLQIFRGFGKHPEFAHFLLTCAFTVAICFAALFISGWILSHTWREEDHPINNFKPTRWLLNHFHRANRAWAETLRPRLETTPLLWQAAFDQRNLRFAWATLGILFLLWLAGLAAWKRDWLKPGIFYLTAGAIIYGVRLQMILRTAIRFSENRQSHYFDFLLASGHTPGEIIRAEFQGIFLQFKKIAWTTRAITFAFVLIPIFLRPWSRLNLAEHAAMSVALLWTSVLRPRAGLAHAMWVSINTGLGASAVFQRSSLPLANFGYQFYRIVSQGLNSLAKFPAGAEGEVFLVFLIVILVIIYLGADPIVARQKLKPLLEHFRVILQSPPRTQNELAKWKAPLP
jgi:hypothetical protein